MVYSVLIYCLSIFKSWVCSTGHKRISILYLLFGAFSGFLSVFFSVFIRFNLAFHGNNILFSQYQLYNVIVTMHGLIMLFFVIIPISLGCFGNFFVPVLIGSPNTIFPRVNLLSFWLLPPSLLLLLLSCFADNGIGTGWTMYPPLSSVEFHSGVSVDLVILSLYLVIFSTILLSINLICTIFFFRMEAMFMKDMPIFVWSILVTSFLLLLAMPVLAATLTLLFFDRNFNTTFFDPVGGGDVILYQHLFWFFGHPETYILIMPSFGIISQVISTFSQKRLFGYTQIVGAFVVIGVLGFFVWGHHMYTSGIDSNSRAYFTTATMIIAIPSGVIVFSWFATLWHGAIVWRVPMLYAVGAVLLFIVGGFSGMFLSNAGIDISLHDTYFVVGHLHYVLAICAMFGVFSGFYYWFTKLIGYSYNELYGRAQFWIMCIGVNITFFPMYILGLSGMPRRIPDYPIMYQTLHTICSFGSFISLFGIFFFLFVIYDAIHNKYRSQRNPWVFLPDNVDLVNRCAYMNTYIKQVNILSTTFFICLERFSIKTTTLEWCISVPVHIHNFIVPPFCITTGLHYLDYRQGSNVLGSTVNMHSVFNIFEQEYLPIYISLNIRRCHTIFHNKPNPRIDEFTLKEWRLFRWMLGFFLNMLLELTFSVFVLFFLVTLCDTFYFFFYVLYMCLFFFFLYPRSYPGIPSSTLLSRFLHFLVLFSNNKNRSIDWFFFIIIDIVLVSLLFLVFIWWMGIVMSVLILFFMLCITYRKSDDNRPSTFFFESFIRFFLFLFDEYFVWYTGESWILFAISDIFCVFLICQLVCFFMFLFGLNPAIYYIVYLAIVLPFFFITYYDNQSMREPSSFVLRRFLEAIGLKWYLLPTISATGQNFFMACNKLNPEYTWDIGKHKTVIYLLRNFRIEGYRLYQLEKNNKKKQ